MVPGGHRRPDTILRLTITTTSTIVPHMKVRSLLRFRPAGVIRRRHLGVPISLWDGMGIDGMCRTASGIVVHGVWSARVLEEILRLPRTCTVLTPIELREGDRGMEGSTEGLPPHHSCICSSVCRSNSLAPVSSVGIINVLYQVRTMVPVQPLLCCSFIIDFLWPRDQSTHLVQIHNSVSWIFFDQILPASYNTLTFCSHKFNFNQIRIPFVQPDSVH